MLITIILNVGTHSTANPPPSPFDPQKENESASKPIFGEGLRYLFKPPSTFPSSQSPQAPEIQDVDMKDAEFPSPQRVRVGLKDGADDGISQRMARGRDTSRERGSSRGEDKENESPERRLISNAAVRRIARRRLRSRSSRGSRAISSRLGGLGEGVEDEEYEDDDESAEDDEYAVNRIGSGNGRSTYKTSNHYTLNMPGPVQPKSDTPYVLLG